MAEIFWFAAYVRSCQERKVAQSLASKGIETYVPVQKVKRQWSDRVKQIDKILLPGIVFVHCDKTVRPTVFNMAGGICGFLSDRTDPNHRALVVPDRQMKDFIRVVNAMNGEEELEVLGCDIAAGDMVRVIRGPLSGFVCECVQVRSRRKLIVRLGLLGSVAVSVDARDIVRES